MLLVECLFLLSSRLHKCHSMNILLPIKASFHIPCPSKGLLFLHPRLSLRSLRYAPRDRTSQSRYLPLKARLPTFPSCFLSLQLQLQYCPPHPLRCHHHHHNLFSSLHREDKEDACFSFYLRPSGEDILLGLGDQS